jgi:N-acyl homoserine lactone hydrolase
MSGTDLPDYTITPILCGMIEGTQWENLTLKRHMGEKIAVPTVMWLVQGGGTTLVVDSGPGDPASVKQLTGRELVLDEAPAAALDRLGVRPAEIATVVLSHLHWDHSGGLDLFPNAEIYVHRRELQWAIAPLPIQEKSYEWQAPGRALPRWLGSRRRMKIIDGDRDIAPGLRLVHLPGHTPGCLGLCCNTRRGHHLIACDAVPTYENIEENVPPGWYVDLEEAYRTLDRIRDMADVVLPGHDIRVFDAPSYPAMKGIG